jgi:flagellar biosynthesis chaperone FliJ
MGMDLASRALAEGVPLGVAFSFRALADYSRVSYATLHRRFYSGLSSEQKGNDQQYLTILEARIARAVD